MNLKFQNKGFTLAEVLITLLIIGVVASLVIPAIIQDSQNAELKTALRSFYSSISNATNLIMLDNGGTVKGQFTNSYVMRDLYADKMSITKKCSEADTSGNCWHMNVEGVIKMLNGQNFPYYDVDIHPGINLTNGVFLSFNIVNPNCDSQYSGLTAPVSCALVRVDVNGFKGPNTIGKDIFDFHVLATSVSPRGGLYDDNHNCEGLGATCAGYILSNP
jgi:prepilin-type N-terminal cleavage/methylation domain-containing protein